MPGVYRRRVLGGFTLGAGSFAVAQAVAAAAEDQEAAPAPGLATMSRRPGEPVRFTFTLDAAPAKAAAGGWGAR